MRVFKKGFLRFALKGEQGITGLETAIILIAFVVVATVFAFVVLTTGIFSSERGKETVFAGLSKARGTLEVRGGIIVTATGGTPDKIQFAIATTAGGDSIPVDPSATNNRMVIAYRDAAVVANDVPYTSDDIIGDGDNLLEPGELKLLVINIGDINPAPTLVANSRFTLELQTPVGAVVDITRSLPAAIDDVMQLH